MNFRKRINKRASSVLRDKIQQAREAIERGDEICYDVAAEHGQIFDNVKHMRWFIEAVSEQL